MKKYIPYLGISLIVAVLGFVLLEQIHPTTASASVAKLTVCHLTSSGANPWVEQQINANELQSHLDNGDFLVTEESPCPPVGTTPTPTMTPTETPTPTVTPCVLWEGEFPIPCPTSTPTPTVTPTVTPEPQTGGSDGGSSDPGATQAHPPICSQVVNAPLLQGFKRVSPTSVAFNWWGVSGVDKYSIQYGYTKNNLVYGEDNIPASSTSITLNGLAPNTTVWAVVTAWIGGCRGDSEPLDP